jgi:surface antigen
MAGNSVGSSLDKADNQAALGPRNGVGVDPTTQYALENAGTGRTYNGVTPTRTYVSNGRNCRDYTISDGYGTNYGSACRMNNGVWVSN